MLESDPANSRALILQKNRFFAADALERLTPGGLGKALSVVRLETEAGEAVSCAPHPAQRLWLYAEEPLKSMDILRKKL